jgi:hypothetical protein
MVMKSGLLGGGYEDYHDAHIQPVLDNIDRQIDDIQSNGAHAEITSVQALDGGDGYGASPEIGSSAFTQTAALNVPAPIAGYGSDMPIATRNETTPPDPANGNQAYDALNAELSRRHVLGTVFPDFNTALGTWADAAQPFQKQYDTELNSKIFAVPGGWQIGSAYSNGSRCSQGGICTSPINPGADVSDGLYWGYIHTHPDNSGGLDPADVNAATKRNELYGGGGAFVSLPNGQINGWNSGMPGPESQYIIRPRRK